MELTGFEIDRRVADTRQQQVKQKRDRLRAKVFADRFDGRTAIITGGASSLGFACAKRILEEGGKVSLWDVNVAALDEARKKLANAHAAVIDAPPGRGAIFRFIPAI